jgi:RimJ/RimL family protein N-acetyltransferase
MPYYRKLEGKQCFLSPCSPEDAELWARWDNDPDVALPLGSEAYTMYSLEREKRALEGVIENDDQVFTIVDRETEEPIGRCLLLEVDAVNRKAMLGIMIGEKSYWSKGYGQEATRLLLEYAFGLLNLNSVMLGTFAFNERALKCFLEVGFKEIGRRRQARIIAGRPSDIVLMDMLAEEFHPQLIEKHLRGLAVPNGKAPEIQG